MSVVVVVFYGSCHIVIHQRLAFSIPYYTSSLHVELNRFPSISCIFFFYFNERLDICRKHSAAFVPRKLFWSPVFFYPAGGEGGISCSKGTPVPFPLLPGSHGWNMREVLHIVVHHSRPPLWFKAGTSAAALADKWCDLYSDGWWDDATWCGCLREPPSFQVMVASMLGGLHYGLILFRMISETAI